MIQRPIFWAVCLTIACLLLNGGVSAAGVNAGSRGESVSKPFVAQPFATFDTPWSIAFLPDGTMLVTEKGGRIFHVAKDGRKVEVKGVPSVLASGQNGLLAIAVSPDYDATSRIYFTYVSPEGDGRLVLAHAVFDQSADTARLTDVTPIWRQSPSGGGGQPGGIIAFAPDGEHLFLTVGDRMRPQTAQDPDQARGKVLRLDLDGGTPADNPDARGGGVRGQTWTSGHRNPYGLAFAPDGRLWLHEMGPRGGDELNLVERGNNYGWPVVSNGDEYSRAPIPDHDTRPEFTPPVVYWTPVIAPAGLVFYEGDMFPEWRGSALIGGLAVSSLIRVAFDGNGAADEVDRWPMGARIRDVAVAPDGSVWVIEDAKSGRLLRLVPQG